MGITSFAGWLRRHFRALGPNPLMRASDRLEALAVFAVLGAALFAVGVSSAAGNLLYDTGVHAATEAAHSRHPVETVVVQGSVALPLEFDGPDYVGVQWRDGTRLRSEQVVTAGTVNAGDPLRIWLDDAGKVVAEPPTTDDARMSATIAAATVWIAIVACAAMVAFGIVRGLERSRDRAWDRELHLMAHNDDGWANRHT
jgi:hypothetical protein